MDFEEEFELPNEYDILQQRMQCNEFSYDIAFEAIKQYKRVLKYVKIWNSENDGIKYKMQQLVNKYTKDSYITEYELTEKIKEIDQCIIGYFKYLDVIDEINALLIKN